MTYEISFFLRSRKTLSQVTYGEERSTELGDQFLEELYADIGGISSNPLLYRVVHQGVRRRLLRRFPYAIYFSVEDGRILVLGVFHCARDPQRIDDELRRRDE